MAPSSLPGEAYLRQGDGGDVRLRAEPLRVPHGVHHPGCVHGAGEPGLKPRSHRALGSPERKLRPATLARHEAIIGSDVRTRVRIK